MPHSWGRQWVVQLTLSGPLLHRSTAGLPRDEIIRDGVDKTLAWELGVHLGTQRLAAEVINNFEQTGATTALRAVARKVRNVALTGCY